MKLSHEALNVLGSCRLEAGKVYLPDQQLDRKLYVEVNKALEALGLKWDRKSKSHLSTELLEDLEDQFFMVVQTGEITTEKDKGLDFFPTPDDLASSMANYVAASNPVTILEPSAGDGALVRAVLLACPTAQITCIELDQKRADGLKASYPSATTLTQDFTTFESPMLFDAVIMNPPFSKRREIHHVKKAISLLKPGGVLAAVMSVAILQREDALTRDLRQILQAGGEITRNTKGSFKGSGTMVETVTVRYKKGA